MLRIAQAVWRRTRSALQADPRRQLRSALARRYLRGQGLEIGALHNPLSVPSTARVRYVDRMSVADLRQQYPELKEQRLVAVDLCDDGEKLARVPDESQDFVIANHFIEHCEDPIGTIKHFFRVLRPRGVLYMAVPDKRHTFDAPREVTRLEHLWADHEQGPERSRRFHFEDFVQAVHRPATAEERSRLADYHMSRNYSIHYHVWTPKEMLELVLDLQRVLPLEIELMQQNGEEVIFVLRKGNAVS